MKEKIDLCIDEKGGKLVYVYMCVDEFDSMCVCMLCVCMSCIRCVCE